MLCLSKEQKDKLIEHSKRDFPREACGILAGRAGKIEKIYEMTNVDKSKMTFFMDPKEQLNVMKKIRGLGLEMLGIYHSHPETEAYPSANDIELAFYPEAAYVIVSLKDMDNPDIRSFRIIEGEISEEGVVLE